MEHKLASIIFKAYLILSMGLNALIVLTHETEHPWIEAAVHSIYPVSLAAAEVMLVRLPPLRNKQAQAFRIVMGLLIAIVALAGSAQNLANLAQFMGPVFKWTLPVVIDAVLMLAMVNTVFSKERETKKSPKTQQSTKQTRIEPAPKIKKSNNNQTKIDELLSFDPDRTAKQIAKSVGCNLRTVYRNKKWQHLHPKKETLNG